MIKDALGLPGGLPIKVGNDTIGGVGVAGAPGGNGDVACAEAAIKAIREQLKYIGPRVVKERDYSGP